MLQIAYDPGYSNTKVSVLGKTALIQTSVSKPKEVGMAAIGMKTAGTDTHDVEFDGYKLCVGPGAWYRGEPMTSMDYMALTSPERLAAFYTAFHLAVNENAMDFVKDRTGYVSSSSLKLDKEAFLVVGLPVPLLKDPVQGKLVVDYLKQLKRVHKFKVDGKYLYEFDIKRIRQFAQPAGAYFDWLIGDDLQTIPGGKDSEAAVIDIGGNTLDLYVVINDKVVENYVGGADVGVKRLLRMMASNGHDLTELDSKLRTGKLVPTKAQISQWVGEIMAVIDETMHDLKRFDIVLPVGGGVSVAGDILKEALEVKGAKLYWDKEPVTKNVRGFARWMRKYAK